MSHNRPVRIGFVIHVMQVAGAEVLVAETIRRLGSSLEPVVICLDAIGELGEATLKSGVPVVNMQRRPGFDRDCIGRLAAEIRTRDLDVLHAHQYTPFFYGGLAARWSKAGTRVIFTEHGRHFPDVVPARRRWTNRFVLRHLAHRITAVCEFSRRALADNDGFPLDEIEVVENGIDLVRYGVPADRAALRARLGLKAGRRYIACIARFHPVKDHRMLLEAFARIAPAATDVDLLLVGDGPLREDLEALTAALGLSGRVQFLGVRSDVPEILAAVDVFVLASVSEAASITLLEAMATGLPVVVTNVGGNPEMVRAGVEGELVPRGDDTAMAAALMRILTDPAAARAMGCRGAQRVKEHYLLDRTIERYKDMYETLTQERDVSASGR